MSTHALLNTLLNWLEDNVNMDSDIFFADDVDSAVMIPAVQAAIELAKNPNYGAAKATDLLDTDCVMDRLGISYSDAALRTSGARDLYNALLGGDQND